MQPPRRIPPAPPESPALVSCLCVTEDRPGFLPWLVWNYRKQDHPARELVVVDGSEGPSRVPEAADVRVVRCPPGTGIARKRNLALEAARGGVVTWFDDDDWQHPRKLSLLAAALGADGVLAGPRRSWFVDLERGRARPHASHRAIVFNGIGARRSAVAGVRFDERRARAADTAWLAAVKRHTRATPLVLGDVLSFWLCHRENVSNPARRYVFPSPLRAVCEAVGEAAWGDTDAELEALRGRLAAR